MTTQKQNQKADQQAAIAKREPTYSERFSKMVENEYASKAGGILKMTDFQKRLAQNYFVSLDLSLKEAEANRLKKDENKREKLAILWPNINMASLAVNVVAYSGLGLDPLMHNHINMVPYKDDKIEKYDIGFIVGYRGLEIKAKKYGLDIPDNVIVELVYANDTFKPIKKDKNNPIEAYEFTPSENPFDRGEIVGGFYYYEWAKSPNKNKLVWLTIADVMKRKPKYAPAEFWGGEKIKWEKDQTTGKFKKAGTEQVEGWYDEMVYKTIYRAAYNAITIDSKKIDDDYVRILQNEQLLSAQENNQEIAENGNRIQIDFTEAEDVTGQPEPEKTESGEKDSATAQQPGAENKEQEKKQKEPELELTGSGPKF